jgi:N-acetylglutamate synthase-like GNAT family acetyltransferase
MTVSNHQVRRATIDDIVALRRLWRQGQLPVAALEKRLTEFQVVETPDGRVMGAIGLKVDQQQGELHSLVLQDSALAEELHPRLWERIQALARNYGLHRLWLTNAASLFWFDQGFEMAGNELMTKRPASFGEGGEGRWLTLKLREAPATTPSIEAELALLRLAQKEEAERIQRRAKALRVAACFIACVVLGLAGLAVFYVMHHVR